MLEIIFVVFVISPIVFFLNETRRLNKEIEKSKKKIAQYENWLKSLVTKETNKK